MVAPNSFKISDNDIVRLYKENRLGDWSKMIVSIARVAGATESDIASILSRRSEDLGDAPTPTWVGKTYVLVSPPKHPVAIDDILVKRTNMVLKGLESISAEIDRLRDLAESLRSGLEESAAGRRG